MSRLSPVARCVSVAVSLATGSVFASADRFDMLGMGILRGDLGSAAYDVNNAGHTAGWSSGFERGRSHAVVWIRPAGLTSLGTLPFALSSEARGINDGGTVVGSSDYWPFVWSAGTGIQSLPLPGQRSGGSAMDVNNTGLIVGFANATQTSEPVAVKWLKGTIVQVLPTLPGGAQSAAVKANDEDQIVGWSDSLEGRRATLWTSKGAQSLGVLSGHTLSEAAGINDVGTVVGSCFRARGRTPFVWTQQQGMRALPLPARFQNAWATAVSNSGTIVGAGVGTDGVTCALVWKDGTVKTLNELAPAIRAAFTIYEANAINDQDQIAGTWIRAGIRSRGYLGKVVR